MSLLHKKSAFISGRSPVVDVCSLAHTHAPFNVLDVFPTPLVILPRPSTPIPLRARLAPNNLFHHDFLSPTPLDDVLLVANLVPHGMNRFGFLVRFLPVLGAVGGSGGGAFGGTFTSGGGEGGADLGFGGGAGGGGGTGAVARIASADKED